MMESKLSTRIGYGIIGVLLLAIGLQVTIGINWGVSMFDTATLVIQSITGLNFGNAAIVLHSIYLLILIIGMKKFHSKWSELAMSVISIFIITRVINVFAFIATSIHFDSFVITFIMFLLSVFIFCIGIYFMSKSNLFISVYDRFCLQLSWVSGKELGTARLICDVSLFVITIIVNYAFDLGVTISLGTFYIIFTSGLQINLIHKLFKIEDIH